MNRRQRDAASNNLSMFGVEAPHTDLECLKMVNTHLQWHTQNKVASPEEAVLRACQNTLGYYDAMEQAANEIKAARSRSEK